MTSHHVCSHGNHKTSSVYSQSVEELDFERGIWQAAIDGDVERVKKLLLKSHPDNPDNAGYTALHYACRAGQFEVCELLFEKEANPNVQTNAGKDTPLHRAAYQGHIKIVNLLLKNGADIFIQNADGQTALHKAAEKNNTEVVDVLVKNSSSLKSIKDHRQRLPVDLVRNKESQISKLLSE